MGGSGRDIILAYGREEGTYNIGGQVSRGCDRDCFRCERVCDPPFCSRESFRCLAGRLGARLWSYTLLRNSHDRTD